jgi:putative two-component system response regulator
MILPSDIIRGRILIVDDREENVFLLKRMLLDAGYTCVASTTDPHEVCELHLKNRYDLILLDLQMPGMDGFQVMEGLREIEPDGYLPILVIAAQPGDRLRAIQAGAKDFVGKPFEPAEVLARIYNMLEVHLLYKEVRSHSDMLEQRVQERTAELQESYLETIFAMTRAAEYKDINIRSHVQRISYLSREFSRMLGLDEEFIDRIFFASPMHDVGKIGIPDHILLKPSALTPGEWEVMKGHASMGSKIFGNSKSPYLKMGSDIALNHHECWEGGGYPNGKRGYAIPLAARIVFLCDIYDALRSRRPYKPPYDHLQTVDIMAHGDGRTKPKYFDPAMLAAFEDNHQSFRDIFEAHSC